MKEVRNCVICQFGKFTVKTTSLRKTCCNACSRIYTLKERKKRYGESKDTLEFKYKKKAADKKYYDKVKNTAKHKARARAAHKKFNDKIKDVKHKAKDKAANKKRVDKIKDTTEYKSRTKAAHEKHHNGIKGTQTEEDKITRNTSRKKDGEIR